LGRVAKQLLNFRARPALVRIVACQHARKQWCIFVMLLAKAHQEAHIARERPAGECTTWRKVRARPDSTLAL
jgi:hypothetical protein